MYVHWPHCYMGSIEHICIRSHCLHRYNFNMVAGTFVSMYIHNCHKIAQYCLFTKTSYGNRSQSFRTVEPRPDNLYFELFIKFGLLNLNLNCPIRSLSNCSHLLITVNVWYRDCSQTLHCSFYQKCSKMCFKICSTFLSFY